MRGSDSVSFVVVKRTLIALKPRGRFPEGKGASKARMNEQRLLFCCEQFHEIDPIFHRKSLFCGNCFEYKHGY